MWAWFTSKNLNENVSKRQNIERVQLKILQEFSTIWANGSLNRHHLWEPQNTVVKWNRTDDWRTKKQNKKYQKHRRSTCFFGRKQKLSILQKKKNWLVWHSTIPKAGIAKATHSIFSRRWTQITRMLPVDTYRRRLLHIPTVPASQHGSVSLHVKTVLCRIRNDTVLNCRASIAWPHLCKPLWGETKPNGRKKPKGRV